MGHPIVRPGRFIFKYLRGIPLIKNENKKEFPQMRGEKRPAREQRQGFFAARGKWRNEWKIIKKHPGRARPERPRRQPPAYPTRARTLRLRRRSRQLPRRARSLRLRRSPRAGRTTRAAAGPPLQAPAPRLSRSRSCRWAVWARLARTSLCTSVRAT